MAAPRRVYAGPLNQAKDKMIKVTQTISEMWRVGGGTGDFAIGLNFHGWPDPLMGYAQFPVLIKWHERP